MLPHRPLPLPRPPAPGSRPRTTGDASPWSPRGPRLSLARLAGPLVLLGSSACAVVTPPPTFPWHETAQREPVGTWSAAVNAGIVGGINVNGGAGGEAQLGWQVRPGLKLGASAVAGVAVDEPDEYTPSRLYNGHLSVRYQPPKWQHFAFMGGVGGGGLDTGLLWSGLSVGMVASRTLAQVVTPFAGVSLSGSYPVVRGEPLGIDYDGLLYAGPTAFATATAGVRLQFDPAWAFSQQASFFYGYPGNALFMSWTGGIQYTFGR